jgi:hypothetical protein
MPYCYYTCNLLPLDLVVRNGHTPRWLGNHLRDPNASARRDALSVHPMTCPFVTKLVAAAEGALGDRAGARSGDATPADADCLVVPGGCDAMRRLGDLLAATYPDRVFVLSMPRSSGAAVTATLAADLARLGEWLKARLPVGEGLRVGRRLPVDEGLLPADRPHRGQGADPAIAQAAAEPPAVEYPTPPRPGGVFLVAGPLSDDSLLRLIGKLGAHVSGLESCTSPDRWKPLAPIGGDTGPAFVAPGAPGAAGPQDYEALAAHLLANGMCPRRSTIDRRDHLVRRLDETRPSSLIYARQSFCDPGAYDALLVAQLAADRTLPFLEIEVDFPFDAGGPLRTRVEAFLEAQLLEDDLLDDDLHVEEG